MTKKKVFRNEMPYVPLNLGAVGARIRKLRNEKNISQETLAELSNLTASHIAHIEIGDRHVGLHALHRLSYALNTSIDDLVYGCAESDTIPYSMRIRNLLKDCTPLELRMTMEITEAVVSIMKKYRSAA